MEAEIKPEQVDSLLREAEVITEKAQVRQLYAGLAVLARDMHQYLAKHEDKSDAAAGFEEVVRLVQAKDATDIGKSDGTFPEYVGYEAELELLPMGLAAAAAQGLNLPPL